MRLPGFLYSCFGDRDKSSDPKPAPPSRRVVATQQTAAEPANGIAKAKPSRDAAVTASSGSTSERQQSEQSQSDATQPTTQPTSIQSNTKVEGNPDEIAPAKAVPQPAASAPNAESDPDAITPVTAPAPMYQNVKQALEDRRSLYERLRRPQSGTPTAIPQQASQQSNLGLSQVDGTKAVTGEQNGS